MATEILDLQHLSSYCSLPQDTFQSLLDAPTVDLVKRLLQVVTEKAREHEKAKSENLKLGVELENAVRGAEAKTRVLKNSIEKGLNEAAELRQKLGFEEQTRTNLENDLDNLKASTSSSTEIITSLQSRISGLESSNRDTVSLLESKSTAYDNLAEELTNQHQKTVELRREVSNLEQSVQSAKAEATTAKFHEQGLQQEIEQLKRNNDWLDSELKTKSSEYTKHRKEKAATIAEVQRQNDELASSLDALTRTEKALRTRLDEIGQKADDAFSRIQQLQAEAARKEEAFNVELNAANRLAELTRNSANTERQRQQELQDQLEAARDDFSRELGQISAECDTEHREREAAEHRVAELEVQVEELEADRAVLQDKVSARSASPQGINGTTTPRQSMSQAFSPSPAKSRGGISVTQLYSDNRSLKGQLESERRHVKTLKDEIDGMMLQLEMCQPQIEELQSNYARSQSEVTQMSALVDSIRKERDQAIKDARKKEGQAEAKSKEGSLLRQQLRDYSSQIKVLLMEIHLRQKGLVDISAERHLQLERLAQGQLSEDDLDDSTDTDRFISQNLVTFRSDVELQEQNSKLLKLVRELGDRMEREEAEKKRSSEAAQSFEELKQKYDRLKDEVKVTITQSQSYVRERDTFKKILFNRNRDQNSSLAGSVDGDAPATPTRSVFNSVDGSPNANNLADYNKLLKEMQVHFDAYRQESATDRSTLKQQVDNLSRSNSELRGEAARSSSQVTLAHERYTMLQENYGMLKNENTELQKRSQFFSDNAAKQEMRTQQVVEDLVEARSIADSIRSETANLKAEREFSKSIEKRLTEDNGNLLREQGRLNSLNGNLQNLLNEREHSDNEARRRLQVQLENTERELQRTKQSLAEEVEESRRTVSRREFENQQNQKRIDDLVSSLNSTREELVAAKTTRGHLQTRVDELAIELRSAEERVSLLQPTPTSRSAARSGEEPLYESPIDDDSGALSGEQELAVQISEMKRDLDLARGELESAKIQVEQYRAISQSSEEELASMNETHDLYRQEMDRLIEEKAARIGELESRISDTSAELASTNSELSELRAAQAENGRRMDEQKASFETKMAQYKDQADRHAGTADFYQEDLKAQAEIAQQAQQNYENELVKHANAAKSLQKVRSEYNLLKIEVVEMKSEADSARTSLAQNEESWSEARERYEREIADLKTGRGSLNAQNDRLHKQLDDVSTQISNLQKHSLKRNEEESEPMTTSAGIENLQEVIRYLRREKEIVDFQLELSSQEAKRLKQQLDYTQTQLEETRVRLNQQRRLEEDSERATLNHNKLIETINELSTFRESNVTLRNETRQAQASLALKSRQVEDLLAEVEPLQAEVRDLKNEIETQAGEATLLKEDRERWQQRTQDILQKYDRIDPAEMEALKNKLHELETERDNIGAAKDTLQQQYDGVSEQVTQAQEHGNQRVTELRQKLTEQFKTKVKQLNGNVAEKDQALQMALKEKSELEQKLATVQEELNVVNINKSNLEQKASPAQASPSNNGAQSEGEEGQVDENESSKAPNVMLETLQQKLVAAETQAKDEASRSAVLQEEVAAYKSRISELESQIVSIRSLIKYVEANGVSQHDMQQTLNSSNAEMARFQEIQNRQSIPIAEGVPEEQIEKLRLDLAQAQQDAESLRTSASVNTSLSNSEKSLPEQLAERVEEIRVELESRHEKRVAQLEENFTTRTNGMKAQLQSKLNEGKERNRQAIAAEHEQAIQKLKTEHEQEMESLKVRHSNEIEELKRSEESKFSQFKDTWISEHTASHDGASDLKKEAQLPKPINEISNDEAKILVQSNEYVRNVLRSNVTKQVDLAKESITAQLKEVHEKALAERLVEAQNKANTAKEQAVSMETKKNFLKVNLADNKLKNAQAKVDVVQKAAKETPSKAVAEVWEIAKDVKAPAAAAQVQPAKDSAAPQQTTPSAVPAQSTSFGQPSAATQGNQSHSQLPAALSDFGKPSLFGKPSFLANPSSFGQPSTFVPGNQAHGQGGATTSPFGQPTSQTQSGEARSQNSPADVPQGPASQQTSSHSNQSSRSRSRQNSPNASNSKQAHKAPNGPQQSQSRAGAPLRPSQAANNPFSQGTAPAALKALQQSGLPVARGSSNRGGGNQRGRGQGRGGPQPIDTERIQGQGAGRSSPQGRNSPVSANLNAAAKQFVPGNKRPREDGSENQHGDNGNWNGKRIRGGAGGS
ncbi:MAG: hypothetical protein Q9195_000675 [Heterodermia aff. obscurata]